jgi:PAS domain S-box-containing protein
MESLVTALPVGISITDLKGRILYVNEQMRRLAGGDTVGKLCWEVYRDGGQRCRGCPLDEDLSIGETAVSIVDGMLGSRIFEVHHTGILYEGKPALLQLFHEVTEHFKAEEALRRSEARYRAMVEHQTEFVVRWLPDGTRTFVNQAYCHHLRASPRELVGTSFYPQVAPEDLPQVKEKIRGLTPERPAETHEHRVVTTNGSIAWQQWTHRGIFDDNGRLIELQSVGTDITDRKRAERALRLTQFAVDRAADAIFWLRPDGRLIYVNDAACESTGYMRDELLSMTVLDIDTDFSDQRLQDLVEEISANGSCSFISHHRSKHGRIFPIEVVANYLEFDGQDYVVALARDITERQETERVLRDNEERLKVLFEFAPDACFLTDLQGVLLDGNRATEVITGFGRDELRGKSLFDVDILSLDDLPKATASLMESARGRPVGPVEYVLTRRDGTRVTVEIRTYPVRIKKQHLVLAIARDITERREAEQALRQSEADLRALVDHATYGIYRSTPAGRFLSVNPTLVSMLGYDDENQVLGLDIESQLYLTPQERKRVLELCTAEGRFDGIETEWQRRDGTPIQVRVSGRPVFGETGDLACFEVFVMDVSEQRMLEEQLRQAQKMEAIGQLTGGIAHDFNNLLSVILLNAEFVASALKGGQPAMLPDVQEIEAAARKAAAMTKQLLGFSRRADLLMVPTNIGRVVRELFPMVRRLLPETIDVEIDVRSDHAIAVADTGAVEQMLLNLATNARDAMKQGGKLRVEVSGAHLDHAYCSLNPSARPGNYVCLSVADTGTGMDAATRARIFDPFFTTKPLGEGTGLGLAMIYGLIKQHGGHVMVYSEPGDGTTFRLYFPAAQVDSSSEKDRESTGGLFGGSETILLVEDETALRRTGRRILEKYGYTVIDAADGEQALKIYEERRAEIDLIVCDLVMPRMSGAEFYKTLRRMGDPVKFILASGYSEKEAERRTLDASVPFVQKPWRLDELLSRLRQQLDGNGADRPKTETNVYAGAGDSDGDICR